MKPEEIAEKIEKAAKLQNDEKVDQAVEIYKEILNFDINQPDALQLLGQVAVENHNFDVAKDLFERSLKSDPEQFQVWNMYGDLLHTLRKPEEAEKAILKALEINPEFARAYQQLSNIVLSRGEKDKGVYYLKRALEINPDLAGAYLPLVKAEKTKPDDPLVDQMKKMAKNLQDQPGPLSMVHHALAAVYQKAGDKKKFFEHLKIANENTVDHDSNWRENLRLRLENTKKVMTPEFLNERVSEEYKIYTPIFIVGMPRSGTTLTDQIFATHSQCFGGDELQYFSKYLERVLAATLQKNGVIYYPELPLDKYAEVATLYQKRVQLLSPGTQFISDKMPWNYQNVGLISKVMPWAKIIHIHRHPMDCGLSCYRNPLPKDLQFCHSMEGYADYRRIYQDYMDFWQETIPDRFINLCYEEMVDNPRKEIGRILDYCGLEWEDDLMNFHKTKREVRTISSDQVIRPFNKDSIGYWKKYRDELAPMEKALKEHGLI